MSEIYAASISTSQSNQGVSVRAHLLYSSDGTARELTLEFPKLDGINANGDVSEWLYSVLSRIVMDYDMHVVAEARVLPVRALVEEIRREA